MRRLIDDEVGGGLGVGSVVLGRVDVKCVYAPVENGAFSGLTVDILCRGSGLVERDSCTAGEQESLEHR